MGCTASKLDNEDTVRRCKERRRLIKAAVYARHHLAAAHSDYCRSLRLTGSALSTFASGEPLTVSDHTPAVFLRTPSFNTAAATTKPTPPPPPPAAFPPRDIPPPSPSPPPPPPPYSPSISSSKLPPILSASSHQRRKKPLKPIKPIKLPHILSDSSISSSPKQGGLGEFNNTFYTYDAKANSSYATTPSQASSVWNWETFYPPSPPDSEYFEQLKRKSDTSSLDPPNHNQDQDDEEDDKASRFSAYSNYSRNESHQKQNIGNNKQCDFFYDDKASVRSSYSNFSSRNDKNDPSKQGGLGRKNSENLNHLSRWDSEEEEEDRETERETEREEVQCSDWGDHDHYSTTSSSDEDEAEEESRSRNGSRSNFGSNTEAVKAAANANSKAGYGPSHNLNLRNPSAFSSKSEKLSSDDGGSSVSWGNKVKSDRDTVADMSLVVRHKDLAEIVAAIKEYFDKAAAAGEQVAEMLETGRAQLDRSFTKLKSGFVI